MAKELKVALLGNNGQIAPLATAATPSNQNIEAYNALLQGNFYFTRLTVEHIRKAISYYEEAIRLDPRYALAYAKLAGASLNLAVRDVTTAEREELTAKARSSVERALTLDPNLAEAHRAKAGVLWTFDFNLAASAAEDRRAYELAPQNAAVVGDLAVGIGTLGQFEQAVALLQRAISLDPLRQVSRLQLASLLMTLGRYDEAEVVQRKAIELQPQAPESVLGLALIQILRGNPAVAVELAKELADSGWRTYVLALAHFANGDQVEADAALKKLIDEHADSAGSQIAAVYALRKDPEKMFVWLEHALTTKDAGVLELLGDPFLRAYKDDPRFIAFAQKVGVMPKP